MTERGTAAGKIRKKLGPGSISLVLALAGIFWGFSFQGGFCAGDYILNAVGLRAWSMGNGTGTHVTVYCSLLFYIAAFLLGNKYKNDFGAKTGKIISLVIGILIVLTIPFIAKL